MPFAAAAALGHSSMDHPFFAFHDPECGLPKPNIKNVKNEKNKPKLWKHWIAGLLILQSMIVSATVIVTRLFIC